MEEVTRKGQVCASLEDKKDQMSLEVKKKKKWGTKVKVEKEEIRKLRTKKNFSTWFTLLPSWSRNTILTWFAFFSWRTW